MEQNSYTINVEMGWNFTVAAFDESAAVDKVKGYLKSLFTKDGFSALSFEAMQNINDKRYTIQDYIGFIVI